MNKKAAFRLTAGTPHITFLFATCRRERFLKLPRWQLG